MDEEDEVGDELLDDEVTLAEEEVDEAIELS